MASAAPDASRTPLLLVSVSMATKPLPRYVSRGRLARRPRQFVVVRVARAVLVTLAVIGALAIATLVVGLLGLHAVTEHISIH